MTTHNYTAGQEIEIKNHPLIKKIRLTKVVGTSFEGWINDCTEARNYFTFRHQSASGSLTRDYWFSNLGTGWNKKLTNETLPQLLGLTQDVSRN